MKVKVLKPIRTMHGDFAVNAIADLPDQLAGFFLARAEVERYIEPRPKPDAGVKSAALPAAPASQQTIAKPSNAGKKKAPTKGA
jgi:hypothetical protein